MKKYTIASISGDGIGPEIVKSAENVLDVCAEKEGFRLHFEPLLLGGVAIDAVGTPFPKETEQAAKESDAVLLGAVGGPKWDSLSGEMRPESALLQIRKSLGLYANLRPAKLYPALRNACPLNRKLSEKGFDFVIVRELIGGIYFGRRGNYIDSTGKRAFDTMEYGAREIERVAELAFTLAESRRSLVTSVDKANVLDSSRLWREVVCEVAERHPTVMLRHLYVDNAAMQLIRAPSSFDVVLCSNLFGDILSDEASALTGSIGLLCSESRGAGKAALFEPIHGSAPDLAGKDSANPLAMILSGAAMLRYLGETGGAMRIERAVNATLEAGFLTADLTDQNPVSLTRMTQEVIARL